MLQNTDPQSLNMFSNLFCFTSLPCMYALFISKCDLILIYYFLGDDNQSWALSDNGTTHHDGKLSENYCKPFYSDCTIVGVHLDMYTGTLSFYIDHQPMGVAFHGMNQIGVPIYPMLCTNNIGVHMCVGERYVKHFSLSERCNLMIARSLRSSTDAQRLPLPEAMIHELRKL